MPGFKPSRATDFVWAPNSCYHRSREGRPMQITLEDDARRIPVEAGDTILASLLRAGVPFPFSCQTGNCGTCKCELVSGEVVLLEHSEHALAQDERARGIILAGRSEVRGDVTVRLIEPGG